MSKAIILCADDYSQNSAICEGILLLVEKKRINAVSCLVNTDLWPAMNQDLKPFLPTCYIGLHLNLTLGQAKSRLWQQYYGPSFSSLSSLLKRCALGQLNKTVVEAEIQSQLDTFFNALGVYPDFIDGHQHIHQLPVIRDVLLNLYNNYPLTSFIRNTSNGYSDLFTLSGLPKQQLIALLGGIHFKNRLKKQAIPANSSFAGIYNFAKVKQYRDYFRHFLTTIDDQGLIMCHPGAVSTDKDDPLHAYRSQELAYFLSDDFLNDLEEKDCQLAGKNSLFTSNQTSIN